MVSLQGARHYKYEFNPFHLFCLSRGITRPFLHRSKILMSPKLLKVRTRNTSINHRPELFKIKALPSRILLPLQPSHIPEYGEVEPSQMVPVTLGTSEKTVRIRVLGGSFLRLAPERVSTSHCLPACPQGTQSTSENEPSESVP